MLNMDIVSPPIFFVKAFVFAVSKILLKFDKMEQTEYNIMGEVRIMLISPDLCKLNGGHEMTLTDIRAGESCIVTKLEGEGALRQHLLDMGVLPGTELTVVKYAPMGDPIEVRIHGYELTLRLADAEQIIVDPCEKKSVSP